MSEDQAPQDVPPGGPPPPPGGQYPPNWGSAYPPPPGGQVPPGQYPPPGYGQPYYYAQPPKHPQATTAMILGILGLVLCGVIGPFAWVMGSKAVKEIDANPNAYSGRGDANAGKIMGIIGTVLLILGVLVFGGLLAIGLAVSSSSDFDYSGMRAF